MSNKAITAVFSESQASGRARLVLLAIADMQGEIGAWPSIATLAKMVNASERSVQRDIQTLVELGELRVGYRQAPNRGQYKANLYWVNLPSLSEVTKTDSEVTEIISEVTDSRSEVTTVGVLTLTEPLLNPQLNSAAKTTNKPKKTIEADWTPSDDLVMNFNDKWPSLKYKIELEAFVNYHLARDSKMANWDAAFRNWCANAVKWAEEKKPKTSVDYNKIKGYK